MPIISYLPQAITDGSGLTGVVHSVALSLPSFISISGSPITNTGTITGILASQAANKIFSGPSSGGAAAPTFRSLVSADFPSTLDLATVSASSLTSSYLYANRLVLQDSDDTYPNLLLRASDGTDNIVELNNFDNDPLWHIDVAGKITSAYFATSLLFDDSCNIVLGTSTGTKIGTGTTQKLAFHNATPVGQYTATGADGSSAGIGEIAQFDATWTGGTGSTAYTVGDIVKALKLKGLIAA